MVQLLADILKALEPLGPYAIPVAMTGFLFWYYEKKSQRAAEENKKERNVIMEAYKTDRENHSEKFDELHKQLIVEREQSCAMIEGVCKDHREERDVIRKQYLDCVEKVLACHEETRESYNRTTDVLNAMQRSIEHNNWLRTTRGKESE